MTKRTRVRLTFLLLSAALLAGTTTAVAQTPADAGEAREPRHISLLIGIGEARHPYYVSASDQRIPSRLDGPPNDVEAIRSALATRGYAPGEMQRVLLNEQATLAGIRRALEWVAEQATHLDDRVVIYYSGMSASSQETGAPGTFLLPWDAEYLGDPDQLLSAEELEARLAAIPARRVVVLLDASYAGGFTVPSQHVLIAATSSTGLAYETTRDGRPAGNFTRDLVEILSSPGPLTPGMILADLEARLGPIVLQRPEVRDERQQGGTIF